MFIPSALLALTISAAVEAVPLLSPAAGAFSNLAERATYANKANAADILSRATVLPQGSYTFQAVTSGDWVAYRQQNGQSFFPNASISYGSPIQLDANSDGSFPNTVRIKPTMSNAKCVSAQWDGDYDGGANWAGVLYACATGPPPIIVGLRPEKQWWYLLSASGLPQGGSPYYVIPVDHILDMRTRGMTDCSHITPKVGGTASSICLDELDNERTDQLWDIQPYVVGGVPVTPAPSPPSPAPAPPAPAPAPPAVTRTSTIVVAPVTTSTAGPTTTAAPAPGITPLPVNASDLFQYNSQIVKNPKMAGGYKQRTITA